jgi:hypothetical protein
MFRWFDFFMPKAYRSPNVSRTRTVVYRFLSVGMIVRTTMDGCDGLKPADVMERTQIRRTPLCTADHTIHAGPVSRGLFLLGIGIFFVIGSERVGICCPEGICLCGKGADKE